MNNAEVWTVMLTPFGESLGIDWDGVDALVDWYISTGVSGIFTVCLSGEMYHLAENERPAMARRVVERAGGRAPIVASGTFGGSLDTQADDVKRMAETGVAAVVVIASQLAGPDEDESVWLRNVDGLLSRTEGIPLGLYECPAPYHRLLSPSAMRHVAETGRFLFHKDTCCSPDAIRRKLEAVEGTPVRWLNANAPTLLYSLQQGGAGFCGIAGNLIPELFVWLCRNFESRPEVAADVQRFISIADMVVRNKYPTCAKIHLANLGLPIRPACRNGVQALSEEELLVLQHLREASDAVLNGLTRL